MDGDLQQDFLSQGKSGGRLQTVERKSISKSGEAAARTKGFLLSEADPCWEKVGSACRGIIVKKLDFGRGQQETLKVSESGTLARLVPQKGGEGTRG